MVLEGLGTWTSLDIGVAVALSGLMDRWSLMGVLLVGRRWLGCCTVFYRDGFCAVVRVIWADFVLVVEV